ncbi:MAG: hypothetical protein O3A00_07475 [Planctomycetota bacterium]|nr:hypothetical protein [Planctomycetota bacterium]
MTPEPTSRPRPGDSILEHRLTEAEQSAKATRDKILNVYCWVLIAVGVYVLSFGPMYWFWYDSVNLGGSPLLKWFYWPLVAICEQVETVNTTLNWYVGLWAM